MRRNCTSGSGTTIPDARAHSGAGHHHQQDSSHDENHLGPHHAVGSNIFWPNLE